MTKSPEELQRKKRELKAKLEADIAAISHIDEATREAVQQLHTKQAELLQRLTDGEIDEEEYVDGILTLNKATPRGVKLASIKILKTLTAGRPDSEGPNA